MPKAMVARSKAPAAYGNAIASATSKRISRPARCARTSAAPGCSSRLRAAPGGRSARLGWPERAVGRSDGSITCLGMPGLAPDGAEERREPRLQLLQLPRLEGLRAVAERSGGVGMHLDQKPVGPGGGCRK